MIGMAIPPKKGLGLSFVDGFAQHTRPDELRKGRDRVTDRSLFSRHFVVGITSTSICCSMSAFGPSRHSDATNERLLLG
jgi:hypothetical protein